MVSRQSLFGHGRGIGYAAGESQCMPKCVAAYRSNTWANIE